MSVPAEFKRLVRCFHADSAPVPFDEIRWIEAQLTFLPIEAWDNAHQFIKSTLGKVLETGELMEIWELGEPDYLFQDEIQLRKFLEFVAERLMR
jgi:hypothetical protein